jgi:hypothetical protein
MKKIMLFALLLVFSLCAFSITPDSKSKSDNTAVPVKKEYRMSDEEINKLTKRGEVMPGLDKSQQTVIIQGDQGQGRRNRRGHDGMNRDNRRSGGVVFIGGGAAILIIIILVIILV